MRMSVYVNMQMGVCTIVYPFTHMCVSHPINIQEYTYIYNIYSHMKSCIHSHPINIHMHRITKKHVPGAAGAAVVVAAAVVVVVAVVAAAVYLEIPLAVLSRVSFAPGVADRSAYMCTCVCMCVRERETNISLQCNISCIVPSFFCTRRC